MVQPDKGGCALGMGGKLAENGMWVSGHEGKFGRKEQESSL
jgi:hypothetical protein